MAFKKWCELLWRDSNGGMQVDFALSVSLVMMVTFGILDLSRAVYADHYVASAARSASRYAMVRGSSWDGATCHAPTDYSCTATSTDTLNYVKSITPFGVTPQSLTVNTTWPGTSPSGAACDTSMGTNSPGCIVTVQVSYSFAFVLPFMPVNSLTLSSTSNVAVAQ